MPVLVCKLENSLDLPSPSGKDKTTFLLLHKLLSPQIPKLAHRCPHIGWKDLSEHSALIYLVSSWRIVCCVLLRHDPRKVFALYKTIKMEKLIRAFLIQKLDDMLTLGEQPMPFTGDPLAVELSQIPIQNRPLSWKLPTIPIKKIIQPSQLLFTSNRALMDRCVKEWGNLMECAGSTGVQTPRWFDARMDLWKWSMRQDFFIKKHHFCFIRAVDSLLLLLLLYLH